MSTPHRALASLSLGPLAFLSVALFSANANAATVAAASCNTADVASAIKSAAEGDTVTVPAGTCTWTSGVTIAGKGITVTGAGAGRIIAYSSSTLSVGTGSKTLTVASTAVTGTPPTPSALSIAAGQTLTVTETGNRQNSMTGTVTSYSAGSLVLDVKSSAGACGNSSDPVNSPSNCGRWLVSTPPSTVLVNNSSAALFAVTEDSTVHTELSGFKIAYTTNGTGTGTGVSFGSGGGQAILLHDFWFEQNTGDSIHVGVSRGVVWSTSFDSTPFSRAPLAVHLQTFDETAWATPSYFGTNDTDGQHNFYVEGSDFHAYLNATDNDEASRSVFRYSTFDNSGFGTHGVDTGPMGQRYFEYYNNIGVYNGYSNLTTFPQDWWFFIRGGTFVIHDNTLPPIMSQDYGTKEDADMTVMNLQRAQGPNPCWGAGTTDGADYYAPRQVGMGNVTGKGKDGLGQSTYSAAALYGYSATEYVGDSEPAYIWANSREPLDHVGTSDYGLGSSNSCTGSTYDTSANYIKLGRDYFNDTTAKPGYTPYPYPHPLAGGSEDGGAPPMSDGGVASPDGGNDGAGNVMDGGVPASDGGLVAAGDAGNTKNGSGPSDATSGGGCSCTTSGDRDSAIPCAGLAVLLLGGLGVRRRRDRAKRAL
jgi:MYXO-CTERM domain-containing protein